MQEKAGRQALVTSGIGLRDFTVGRKGIRVFVTKADSGRADIAQRCLLSKKVDVSVEGSSCTTHGSIFSTTFCSQPSSDAAHRAPFLCKAS